VSKQPPDHAGGHPAVPIGGRGASGNAAAWDEHNLGEVYFEFRPVGAYMRVNIIHAATGFETFVLGPLNASHGDLERLALRKLKTSLNNRK
jgi:hypothetical protein